jgi:hypothetical protein
MAQAEFHLCPSVFICGFNSEEIKMDVRLQISMVFHLDKCIGCHTCTDEHR